MLKTVGIGAESGVESSSNLEGVIRDLISRDKLGLAVQTLPPELHKPLAEAAGGNVFMLAIESMRRANFAEQKLEALTGTKESNDETKTDESKAVAS
ncbi:MAG: hypothetical protein IT462_12535 [Planctomycetes bacterium]|nr:hypothetical protein [Planctomycetota bacterium]